MVPDGSFKNFFRHPMQTISVCNARFVQFTRISARHTHICLCSTASWTASRRRTYRDLSSHLVARKRGWTQGPGLGQQQQCGD